jgi:hypothetical protein
VPHIAIFTRVSIMANDECLSNNAAQIFNFLLILRVLWWNICLNHLNILKKLCSFLLKVLYVFTILILYKTFVLPMCFSQSGFCFPFCFANIFSRCAFYFSIFLTMCFEEHPVFSFMNYSLSVTSRRSVPNSWLQWPFPQLFYV